MVHPFGESSGLRPLSARLTCIMTCLQMQGVAEILPHLILAPNMSHFHLVANRNVAPHKKKLLAPSFTQLDNT